MKKESVEVIQSNLIKGLKELIILQEQEIKELEELIKIINPAMYLKLKKRKT